MWDANVRSAISASHMAAHLLNPGGLLVLTGAAGALRGTPGMIGYGVSKTAVHHLVESLSHSDSKLPTDTTVVGILPITIDTPANRSSMPKADYSTWTPPQIFATTLLEWSIQKRKRIEKTNGDKNKRLVSGGLYRFKTEKNETKIENIKVNKS